MKGSGEGRSEGVWRDVPTQLRGPRRAPADEQLPSKLAAVIEDSARTIELPGGYEMELTEAEARALLTYATSHDMRPLERDLRQELISFERRLRESGPTRSSG